MTPNVALTGLAGDLHSRPESGHPVRIGLIGPEEMGTDSLNRAGMIDGATVTKSIARSTFHSTVPAAARNVVLRRSKDQLIYGKSLFDV